MSPVIAEHYICSFRIYHNYSNIYNGKNTSVLEAIS
jgi:hypothetical protein